jgi:hypoxanthine-guanine phosphoribosyltransferase
MRPVTHDHPFAGQELVDSVLIDEEELQERVIAMGRRITEEYEGRDLVLVTVLKGGFMFLADLTRGFHRHDAHPRVDFMTLSSYGADTVSSGVVR